MGGKSKRRISAILALLPVFCMASAQMSEQADSLVRLLNAESIEFSEQNGVTYRKAYKATFLHNGTYLSCDTSLWNVDSKLINCKGNVQLLQEETVLTSDNLDYLIDDNLAKFRGSVVQLQNKKENTLRTKNLDYNTKDSVAFFRGGAAMKDKDGQVIECDDGKYESAGKLFTFEGNVNMFTDSAFVKTTHLEYDGEHNLVDFKAYVDFWKDDNMLSAGNGWYNRNVELFFFRDDVHGLTRKQECWSDSLYYYRKPNNVILRGRAHVQDSSRKMAALADYILYQDSLSRVTMKKQAAVALETAEGEKRDTIYFGADTLIFNSRRMCDIEDSVLVESRARLQEIREDAVQAYRQRTAKEAAEAAARAMEEKAKDDPNLRNRMKGKTSTPQNTDGPDAAPADTAALAPADTVALAAADTLALADSLAVADSLAIALPPDTTKVGFLLGISNVKVFRRDIQARSDSLVYCDLDSIARFYREPVVWHEGNRQYTADSLFLLVRSKGIDRASLMSNAFIATKESDQYFNQISGTDVMAFFDSTSALKRFDALGGANAVFYLKEEGTVATVNKVACKMMSATFKDGNVERVFYFESPKNDAYPVVQLPKGEHFLKGFDWKPEGRPEDRTDVTSLEVKPSERDYYEGRPKARFKQTDIYFPGYMDKVYKDLEEARIRKNTPRPGPSDTSSVTVGIDSTGHKPLQLSASSDSLALKDSVKVETPAPADTVSVVEDTSPVTRKELREQARKLAIARRDAEWARRDSLDAAKAAVKAEKARAKKRAATKKALIRQQKQEARDEAKLQKYMKRYQKKRMKKGASISGEEPDNVENHRRRLLH